MRKIPVRDLCLAAMVGALYAVLSYFGGFFGLSYGPIQCRFAEALCVLPCLFPCTVPGLFVGCFIANLLSTVGPLDLILGPLATLLAAMWTARVPHRLLAPFPPVICNGLIVGGMITWYEVGFTARFWPVFAFNAVTVAIGELIACCVLGTLLLHYLPKVSYLREMCASRRFD